MWFWFKNNLDSRQISKLSEISGMVYKNGFVDYWK